MTGAWALIIRLFYLCKLLFTAKGKSSYSPISPSVLSFHSCQICPFRKKFFKKQSGESCGSPAIIGNGINTHHNLFITINLPSSKPLLDIPSLFTQPDDTAQIGLFSALGHLWVSRATKVVSLLPRYTG